MSNLLFENVAGLRPGKSVFDLSYLKTLTCDMGQLIPVMCEEMVPGDIFKFGNQSIIRFQPLLAPVMHEINVFVHYFFVPYRLLWNNDVNTDLSADEDTKADIESMGNWEDFITGGVDGDNADSIPTWTPTDTTIGSLWDFLGFLTGVNPTGALPIDFPRRAYNYIYHEYYRDETLQDQNCDWENESILLRNWEKDYFTSSLPFLQRGTTPALPISGFAYAEFPAAINIDYPAVSASNLTNLQIDSVNFAPFSSIAKSTLEAGSLSKTNLDNNTVDLSDGTAFSVNDIRTAFQIQKWMERNARAGVRYTEFLKSHYGESPRDERLQRPEYCGGTKNPVIISETLQTSATDSGTSSGTPQGNMSGHGIALSDSYAGKYHAKEYGLIMGIMSVMPKPMYMQGINRQWLRETRYDFYFPEFANLSEQAITNAEICAKDADSTHNTGIFGYQGRYDEMRIKHNMVCGEMRDTFDYWHLARIFNPASPPELNSSFIQCNPGKRIFAVQDEPTLMVQFSNLIKAFRPIPITPEPGLIDHD